jgi:hypothetical protein
MATKAGERRSVLWCAFTKQKAERKRRSQHQMRVSTDAVR